MEKVLALVLLLVFTAGASYAEELKEWNISEMIHPQLKEGLKRVPYFELNSETLFFFS